MNSKKTLAIICTALAALTAVFGVLTVINLTGDKEPGKPSVKSNGYIITSAVEYDAPAAQLSGVISNNMKATASYPAGILEGLKQAYSINNDLVGWLSIPGTELDTAVLQGKDNSYYLKKDFYGRTTGETSPDELRQHLPRLPLLEYRPLKEHGYSRPHHRQVGRRAQAVLPLAL